MTNKTFLLPILFLAFSSAFAQELSPCATVTTDEVRKRNLSIPREERVNRNTRNVEYLVPIRFHSIGDDDGKGFFPMQAIHNLLCNVNKQYEPLKIRFYIYDKVNFVSNSTYYNHDWAGGYDMMVNLNESAVINTYIVNNAAGACGYAYYPNTGPNGGGIVLAKSCSGVGNSTFAHELGHYFSLPHTFDQWDTDPEYVDGTNCETTGDFFCDTRADFLDYRWNCPYNLTTLDPNGDPYNPDGTNFMSYSNEPCATNLSSQQQSAVLFSLENDYNGELISHPNPSLVLIDKAVVPVSPPHNANIPNWEDSLVIKWNSVEGAEYYHFILHLKNLTTMKRIDTITSDTFYVHRKLVKNSSYEWKVKAAHNNSTCAPYSPRTFFTTNEIVTSVSEQTLSENKIEVFPNPAFPGEDLNLVAGEAGKFQTLEIGDLQGRSIKTYTYKGDQEVETIRLPELSGGVYLILLKSEKQVLYKKLVIQDK